MTRTTVPDAAVVVLPRSCNWRKGDENTKKMIQQDNTTTECHSERRAKALSSFTSATTTTTTTTTTTSTPTETETTGGTSPTATPSSKPSMASHLDRQADSSVGTRTSSQSKATEAEATRTEVAFTRDTAMVPSNSRATQQQKNLQLRLLTDRCGGLFAWSSSSNCFKHNVVTHGHVSAIGVLADDSKDECGTVFCLPTTNGSSCWARFAVASGLADATAACGAHVFGKCKHPRTCQQPVDVYLRLYAPLIDDNSSDDDNDNDNGQKHQVVYSIEVAKRPSSLLVHEIQLNGAVVVEGLRSGSGPLLYLTTSQNTYEFFCDDDGPQTYEGFWLPLVAYFGARVCKPMELLQIHPVRMGQGSFGAVVPCAHRPTGKTLCLKQMSKSAVLNKLGPGIKDSFHVETEILQTTSHPFIVKFHAAFAQQDHFYMVLEKLAGGTVWSYVHTKGVYTESQARKAATRLLIALLALSSKKIVHRDLKPENVLLESADDPTSVKLIDFGLAAFTNSQRMQMRCGSPGFVAPEIIQRRDYGSRVDVFSLGVLVYVMLTSCLPFSQSSRSETILSRNERCVFDFSHENMRYTSAELRHFLVWTMQADPSRRLSLRQAFLHPWIVGFRPPGTHLKQLVQSLCVRWERSHPGESELTDTSTDCTNDGSSCYGADSIDYQNEKTESNGDCYSSSGVCRVLSASCDLLEGTARRQTLNASWLVYDRPEDHEDDSAISCLLGLMKSLELEAKYEGVAEAPFHTTQAVHVGFV